MVSTFDSHLEGKENRINLIEMGYLWKDVQKAKQEALKELKEWEICEFCNKKPNEKCRREHYVAIPIQAIEKCFGRME